MDEREAMAALEHAADLRKRSVALMEEASELEDQAFGLNEEAEELEAKAKTLEAKARAKADPQWLELHLARSDRRQIALPL